MKQVNKNNTVSEVMTSKNPIIQMIEDKKRIVKAIKKGESLSTLKGIKIVSPL
jgi:hypothetical protein